MARGRKPTSQQEQEDRGNPGRRAKAHAARTRDGNLRAKHIATDPDESADRLAPPSILKEPGAQGALEVWRRMVPELSKMHAYDERFDRETFALYCIWVSEFHAAYDDVLRHGRTVRTKMTNGGYMLRRNPAIKLMETAHNKIVELANHFGTTSMTRIKLISQMPAGWLRERAASEGLPLDPDQATSADGTDGDQSSLPLADADPAAAFAQMRPQGPKH